MPKKEETSKNSSGCFKWIVLAAVGIIIITGAMWITGICPPEGPWMMPPWCESGVAVPSVNKPLSEPEAAPTNPPETLQSVQEGDEITHYMPSKVDIYGRISYENIDDLPLSITYMAWGEHIPSNNFTEHWWMQNEQKKGAKHISVVSIWNNDQWEKVEDLPAELKTAYITDFDGNPLYIQGKIFLNLLDPALQQRLKDEMKAHIDAGTDGFAFDEHWGTAQALMPGWGPGPFDEYSLAGFRNYLVENYSADELLDRGISDISSFNYQDFLVEGNYTERYTNEFWSNPAPLAKDYQRFLFQSSNNLIEELMAYATAYAQQKGETLVFAANANPLYQTDVFKFYEKLDLFIYEHEWFAEWRKDQGGEFPAGAPVTPSVKYAASLEKRAAVMPMLNDVANLETSARQMIFNHEMAETYASGGYYMFFPDINYIGINYTTPRETIYPYFAFIREHPEAFQTISFPAEVAVLKPSTVLQEDTGGADTANGFSMMLVEHNIPHDVIGIDKIENYQVVLAGGFTWRDKDVERLLSYIKNGGIVIASDTRFASKDEKNNEVNRPAIKSLKTNGTHLLEEGKFVFFTDDLWWKIWAQRDEVASKKILDIINKNIFQNIAPEKVQILPYSDDTGRLVVHILNYDFSNGDFERRADFQIQLQLPQGISATGKKMTLISPDFEENLDLRISEEDGVLTINIPSLYVWDVAILE